MAGPQKQVVEQIPVDEIVVDAGRREVDPATVSRLAESIGSIGLKTPITVRLVERADPETGEVETYHVLVAGRHRLEAFRELGLPYVPSLVVQLDDIDAELWEIAENLHRADLSKEQRDVQIRRYAELLTKKAEGISGQNVQQFTAAKKRGRPEGIAAKVAKQTGVSAKTVKRALAPKVVRVPDAPLDEEDAKARWIGRGMKWWNEGPASWREEFRALTDDQPVMDARHAPSPADGIPDFLRRTA